jgi:hypothetical protein
MATTTLASAAVRALHAAVRISHVCRSDETPRARIQILLNNTPNLPDERGGDKRGEFCDSRRC